MILAATLGGAKAYIDHQLDQELGKIAKQITVEYSQVSSSLLGQVVVENIDLNSYGQVHINRIILHQAYQFYNNLPKSMSLNLEGVQIPINNTTQPIPLLISAFGYEPYYLSLQELYNLGYSKIDADISLDAKLQNNKLSVLGIIDANIWGKFTILAELDKVAKPFNTMELVSFQVKYFDHELVNKAISHLAQRNKITPTQLQQNFISKLTNDIKQADITNNLKQFMQNPKVLTINLEPKLPMNINVLKTFPLQNFRLTITASTI